MVMTTVVEVMVPVRSMLEGFFMTGLSSYIVCRPNSDTGSGHFIFSVESVLINFLTCFLALLFGHSHRMHVLRVKSESGGVMASVKGDVAKKVSSHLKDANQASG